MVLIPKNIRDLNYVSKVVSKIDCKQIIKKTKKKYSKLKHFLAKCAGEHFSKKPHEDFPLIRVSSVESGQF